MKTKFPLLCKRLVEFFSTLLMTFLLSIQLPLFAGSGGATDPPRPVPSTPEENETMFIHSKDGRFWISGQMNIIFQVHSSFPAKYSGVNSFFSRYEKATSHVLTLYTGVKLNQSTEVLFDLETAGGQGLSAAGGLGGYTNLDVVRNPQLSNTPYIARLMLHKVVALGQGTLEVERGPLSLATELPARRLEFRVGKFGTVDFFDLNPVGSDSHFQFMNWSVDNNGAYDFVADTRGYTWGIISEYHDHAWSFRFAEGLMPKVANGIDLEWNLSRAHSENFEFEVRHNFLPGRPGTVRLLSFVNHANMGIYRQAIDRFLAGRDSTPNITAHSLQTSKKYGFGINLDQSLSKSFQLFGRWGWNDGKTETFAYTEIDRTLSLGFGVKGDLWKRKHDRSGLAYSINGLSGDHRRYLELGGHGFLLGDGALTYGREKILEMFYTVHLWKGLFAAGDLQYITHPGYNRDRGPVLVPSLRLHVEF